ncbi:MAG: ADP-ribosyltransferase [Bacilli bacterium]|nr:ADP-ribosyltransferase [Bacilli bacterium]
MRKALLLPLLLTCLTNCSSIEEENFSRKPNQLYSDHASFTDGTLEFNFHNIEEYSQTDNCLLYVTMDLTSRDTTPVEFKFDSLKVYRESNNAEYAVSGYVMSKFTLQCDIKKTIKFSCTVPTSYKKDKYKLEMKYNSKELTYHFYEMPDELRKDIDVTFVIDGVKNSVKAKEGRPLDIYEWISTDYIYGCNEYYFENDYKTKVELDYLVKEPITLYGKRTTVLKYQTPDGINAAYVSGYNFIPSSGEIVIPKSFSGLSIYSILAGSFKNECKGLQTIYIPRNVKISSSYNFYLCSELKTVHFEGTEAEWKTVNEAIYPSTTEIIFNSYK